MKKLSQLLSAAGLAAALTLASFSLLGQDTTKDATSDQGGGTGRRNRDRQGGGGPGGPGGPGNFDPEQMRQRMMERLREQFGVKDDEEWKIISERIEKVNTARREVGGGRNFAMFGGRGGPGGAGGGGGGAARAFGGEPSPEADALRSAIENNASADDIKAKLAKYREVQKEKEAKLAKAQEDLKAVLSAKQEAAAVLAGYLK